MRTLLFASALPAGVRAQKLARLRKIEPEIEDLELRWSYLAALARELAADELAKVKTLIGEPLFPEASSPDTLHIGPRIGTISPFASRAVELLDALGVGGITRIERLLSVKVRLPEGAPISEALREALFDRMREQPFASFDEASALFRTDEPEKTRAIPLLRDG